jgi:hypothetical protein
MTIREPTSYGLILRCGPFTRAAIRRFQDELRDGCEDDSQLFGVTVGSAFEHLLPWLDELDRAGLQRGAHYVVTLSTEGVIGELPRWLECRVLPRGRVFDLVATTTSPGRWSARLSA